MDQNRQDEIATGPGNRRLEERVYDRLLHLIRQGHYTLGQKLPSEQHLAAEHRVSRPVVRAALAHLRDDGLIVSRRGAGSFVSTSSRGAGGGYAPLQGIEDIAAYIAFRKVIEADSAARAADRADPEGVARLETVLSDMDEAIDAGTDTIDLDYRFHREIAQLSDNRFLVETLSMMRQQMVFIGKFVRSLGRTGYLRGKRAMRDEHWCILAAIEAGDPAAARAAMEEHIDASERRVFKGE